MNSLGVLGVSDRKRQTVVFGGNVRREFFRLRNSVQPNPGCPDYFLGSIINVDAREVGMG